MKQARLYSDKMYPIGEIDDKLYASFIEHLGRAVYTGIYEPGHPTADENGFRQDTMDAIQTLKVPMIRYPGGNFVSMYNWKDGIGPRENRPMRMDFAWTSIEPNQFGIDEFCQWAEKAGIEPMIAVNLGTGTIQEAGELVEYCNHPGGTYWSDLRIKNGRKEPYNIKYWCLGNEMEGPWQAGHLCAEDYAKKAREAAKMMRWVDDSIKLIACGSSYHQLPEYLEWDRILLNQTYDFVDYLSTHYYIMRRPNMSVQDFLSAYKALDEHIKNSAHVLEFVKRKLNKKKTIPICLDEWNVWNFSDLQVSSMEGLIRMKSTAAEPWETAPPILEEKYSLLDALTLGGLGISLLNNADTVEIACLAQLVNVIAPITTKEMGGVLKQSIFHVFRALSEYGRGTSMKGIMDAPRYTSMNGELNVVESALVYNEEADELRLFLLNCDEAEDVELDIQLCGYGDRRVAKHLVLKGEDLAAINSFEDPERVLLQELPASGKAGAVLPKLSWNVLVLQ